MVWLTIIQTWLIDRTASVYKDYTCMLASRFAHQVVLIFYILDHSLFFSIYSFLVGVVYPGKQFFLIKVPCGLKEILEHRKNDSKYHDKTPLVHHNQLNPKGTMWVKPRALRILCKVTVSWQREEKLIVYSACTFAGDFPSMILSKHSFMLWMWCLCSLKESSSKPSSFLLVLWSNSSYWN